MVLVGELHVANQHLPNVVQTLAQQRLQQLVIYQNCHEIYWQLERRGLEHKVELVRVRPQEYCLINTPPIVCQQSFLNWLEVDDEVNQLEAPEQNFKDYARLIASFFDLPLGEALDEVELATVVDLSFLSRLRRRGDFSNADMVRIRKQILRSESYYIPRAKMVYLGNLSVNHASEEATHFVRHVCSGSREPRLLVDAFYARVLEEAIGFLGSKLINHKRKCPRLTHFEQVLRSKNASGDEKKLAQLVLKHHKLETGRRVHGLTQVYECDQNTFDAVTHVIGYRLGESVYYALVEGHVLKHEVRNLFFADFANEGEALATYFYLLRKTIHIKTPERL